MTANPFFAPGAAESLGDLSAEPVERGAQAEPYFEPVVLTGLRPDATLAQLLAALAFEAQAYGMSSPWGVSVTASLLERAIQALKERSSPADLAGLAVQRLPVLTGVDPLSAAEDPVVVEDRLPVGESPQQMESFHRDAAPSSR